MRLWYKRNIKTKPHLLRHKCFTAEQRISCHDVTDHIRVLDIELELACNGGLCGGVSLNLHFEDLPSLSFKLVLV